MALLLKHFRDTLLNFWVFSSFVSKNAGGVIIFVSKDCAPNESQIIPEVIIPGRALRLKICNPLGQSDGCQFIYNIHNFGVARDEIVSLANFIKSDYNYCKTDPILFSIFCTGDFNFSNVSQFSFSEPSHNTELQDADIAPAYRSPNTRILTEALAGFMEIDPKLPTRFDSTTLVGRQIDMIYAFIPTFICPLCDWDVKTPYCPKQLFEAGISDHAPVVACISNSKAKPPETLPIAVEIVKSRHFRFFWTICAGKKAFSLWKVLLVWTISIY